MTVRSGPDPERTAVRLARPQTNRTGGSPDRRAAAGTVVGHVQGTAARGQAQAVAEERARVRRARRRRRARPAPRLVLTIVTFVAFCLAASGIYFWNDLLDVEADRIHPTKRFRPIASGELSITAARVVGVAAAARRSRPGRAHGRWQTVGRHRPLHRDHAALHRVVEARRRGRPRHHRRRLRAPGGRRRGGRRRADVALVRALHHVRLAVHRHRQALRRAARGRRGCRHAAADARRVRHRVPAHRARREPAAAPCSATASGRSRPRRCRRPTCRSTSCRSCRC